MRPRAWGTEMSKTKREEAILWASQHVEVFNLYMEVINEHIMRGALARRVPIEALYGMVMYKLCLIGSFQHAVPHKKYLPYIVRMCIGSFGEDSWGVRGWRSCRDRLRLRRTRDEVEEGSNMRLIRPDEVKEVVNKYAKEFIVEG